MRSLAIVLGILASACSLDVSYDGAVFACDNGACPDGLECRAGLCLPPEPPPDPPCASAIAAGDEHACTIRSDGTVWCWGRNQLGQLGDGTTSSSSVPIQIATLENATAIGAGADHACAVVAGAVWCWGKNLSGQLGNGSTVDSPVPVQVTGVDNAKAIAGGSEHTCALRVDGSVWCWGANTSGQLGDGTMTAHGAAAANIVSVVEIAARANSSCAALGDGSVKCWGDNAAGQLGTGNTMPSATPIPVTGVVGARSVAVGDRHACAVATDVVRCWGENLEGQLGDGSEIASLLPKTASLVQPATAVVAGRLHTCARDAMSRVWCWGANTANQLGDGLPRSHSTSPVLAAVSGAAGLAAGGQQTCARGSDGSLACFGANTHGQLGDGERSTRPTAQPVPALASGVTGITAGGHHACAWKADGSAHCWGANGDGEVGDGTLVDRASPVPIGIANVQHVDAGYSHTCAVLTDGTVRCWGRNTAGQLGTGNTVGATTPVNVLNIMTGVAVSAGGNTTCVRPMTGNVICFGFSGDGQFGNGVFVSSATPTTMNFAGAIQLALGFDHSSVFSGGNAYSCGANDVGQIGGGTANPDERFPIQVSLATGQTAEIAAGGFFGCARHTDGTVRCWGLTADGRLGDGVTGVMLRRSPVQVSEGAVMLTGAQALWVGDATACVRKADHSLWCWGAGYKGQFGDGSFGSYLVATQVLGAQPGPYDLAIGLEHVCMLRDGAVSCWGSDLRGELGIGEPNPPTPRTVALTCPVAP